MVHRIPLIVNADASQIQEVNETTDSLAGGVPLGAILMWGGGNTIPTGFTLCNAANAGTVNGITVPNLEDKFIIGAKQYSSGWKTNVTGSLGASGGSKDAVLVQHAHQITDNGHQHTVPRINLVTNGAVQNGFAVTLGSGQSYQIGYNQSNTQSTATTNQVSTGITVNQSTGSAATNNRLPPYIALAYIIRTS